MTPRPASEWAGFISQTIEQLFTLDPAFAVYQGRHDFDGRLPDWSETGLQNMTAFWQNGVAQANAFTGLDPTQQFEKDLFVQFASAQLFWLQDADMPHSNPAFYINGGLDPNVYLTRAYADLPTRMRAVIGFLQAVPGATTNIRANLRMPMPATFISYASAAFHGYATYYSSDIQPVFASVNDPALQSAAFDGGHGRDDRDEQSRHLHRRQCLHREPEFRARQHPLRADARDQRGGDDPDRGSAQPRPGRSRPQPERARRRLQSLCARPERHQLRDQRERASGAGRQYRRRDTPDRASCAISSSQTTWSPSPATSR